GDLPVLDLEPRRKHRRQPRFDDARIEVDAARLRVREDQLVLAERIGRGPQRVADRELDAVLGIAHVRRERHARRLTVDERIEEPLGELAEALLAADDAVLRWRRARLRERRPAERKNAK